MGQSLCDAWISLDVLLCTASILNLCCISLDRYLAIVRPLWYKSKKTTKKALGMISVSWFISVIISCPPLLGWHHEGHRQQVSQCLLTSDPGYVVFSALGSFFLPLIFILFVNLHIYVVIQRRNLSFMKQLTFRRKKWGLRKCASLDALDDTTMMKLKETSSEEDNVVGVGGKQILTGNTDGNAEKAEGKIPLRQQLNKTRGVLSCTYSVPSTSACLGSEHATYKGFQTQENFRKNKRAQLGKCSLKGPLIPKAGSGKPRASPCISLTSSDEALNKLPPREQTRASMRSKRKTHVTLLLIVSCFVTCWLPYFLVYLIQPFCDGCTVHPTLHTTITWLGYLNSALNPVVYALCNRQFSKSFVHLTLGQLCFRKARRHQHEL